MSKSPNKLNLKDFSRVDEEQGEIIEIDAKNKFSILLSGNIMERILTNENYHEEAY